MDPDKIVRDFCAAWSNGNLDELVDAFADDAVYHNIPMAPLEGKDAIRTFLGGMVGGMASEVHFEILTQLVSGFTVMNERIDTLVMGDKTVQLPVCGVFELNEDGKIKAWRDYFDMAMFTGAGS